MTSLFPNINLDQILEIEYILGSYYKCGFDFDGMDFFKFLWLYDRHNKHLERQEEQNTMQELFGGYGTIDGRTLLLGK